MEVTKHFYKSSESYAVPKGIVYHNVRENGNISVFGLYNYRTEQTFKRMPTAVAETVNDRVRHLHTNPAGGRVRFKTDSKKLAIKAEYPRLTPRSILTAQTSMGFDIYLRKDGVFTFHTALYPPIDMTDGYEKCMHLGEGEHEVEIYMPLYNDLDSMYIGIEEGATLEATAPYTHSVPILYYGSSITQGASASRPGNAYSAIVERRLDADFINLGFASGALGEKAMADYIASLSFSAFVCDYDYNAPSAEHLEATHFPLYQTIRASHPDTPILLITKPILLAYSDNADNDRRRRIIYETYRRAEAAGDRNIYLLDGKEMFAPYEAGMACADGVHPGDFGMWVMAENIVRVLKNALGRKEMGK